MLIIIICFQRFVNYCYSVYLELLLKNSVSTFIILLLILLSNDVEPNPGPAKEGELSVFHLSTRCMRHKLDYIESISNEADIICLIRVITKLPNSEQSNKGKVKTHKYINRQNQSTTRKL